MTDWRTAMRDAGGRDEQDELSPADAETMRRLVMAAAGQPAESPARASWRRPMFVVATVAGVIAVGAQRCMQARQTGRLSQRVPTRRIGSFNF